MGACPNCLVYLERERELHEEIQSLHLRLYWTFKDIMHLELEMRGLNDRLPGLQCGCSDCRCPAHALPVDSVCRFRPLFLQLLESLGLSYDLLPGPTLSTAHFLLPPRGLYGMPFDHTLLQYGPGLLEAKYGSEALGKLDRLFELLGNYESDNLQEIEV